MSEIFMNIPWWVYCAILTFGAAGYGIAMRFMAADIHPSLFGAAFTCCSSLFLAILLFLFVQDGSAIEYTPLALVYAVLAGLALVGVDIGIIKMYQNGAPVSLGMPIVRVTLSLITAIIGFTFFAEALTVSKISGIILGSVGMFLALQKPKVD